MPSALLTPPVPCRLRNHLTFALTVEMSNPLYLIVQLHNNSLPKNQSSSSKKPCNPKTSNTNATDATILCPKYYLAFLPLSLRGRGALLFDGAGRAGRGSSIQKAGHPACSPRLNWGGVPRFLSQIR